MASSAPAPAKQRPGHLIFVLGAPGVGKGTNCQLLASDSHFNGPRNLTVHHASVGDLLRKQVAAAALPHALAEKVEKQILMDGKDIIEIIAASQVLDKHGKMAGQVLILDGFPRNMDQLRAFSDRFGEPDLVLSLVCQRQVAMDRYLRRRDATRPDGDEALFIKRCDEFERENPGILQHYNKIIPGRVLEVDVSSLQGIEDGYNKLKDSLLKQECGPWFPTRSQDTGSA